METNRICEFCGEGSERNLTVTLLGPVPAADPDACHEDIMSAFPFPPGLQTDAALLALSYLFSDAESTSYPKSSTYTIKQLEEYCSEFP